MLAAGALAVCAVLGIARLWEWRQPKLELEGARIASVTPYESGGGAEVSFEGQDGTVDFPPEHWDASLQAGDTVNAMIRRSFFGADYDGLQVAQPHADPGQAAPTTSQPARDGNAEPAVDIQTNVDTVSLVLIRV